MLAFRHLLSWDRTAPSLQNCNAISARIFNTTSIFNGLELGEAKVKVYGNEIDSAPVAEKKYEDFHAKGASGFQLYIKSKFASPG
jgi:hypothetical protein